MSAVVATKARGPGPARSMARPFPSTTWRHYDVSDTATGRTGPCLGDDAL